MPDPTDASLAGKHDVSVGVVQSLREAFRHGGGRQAQFSHPELGGMGQWSAGGMVQIGDMFNTALKAKVDALCRDLAEQPATAVLPASSTAASTAAPGTAQAAWWPDQLGTPSAAGSQNGMRYACFPAARRVAIEQAGRVTLYDSGEHRIAGVAQSQSATQDLSFTSQLGTVRAADLPVVQ